MKAKNMTKRLFAGLLAAAMVFTSAPMTQAEAAKKKAVTITVTTQAELNAALAKKGVTSIVIKTKDNVTLKLNNSASKAKLVVDAPNARISNSAKLAGITIKDAKAFTEKSVKGNSITVADKKLSLTVAQAAQNVTVRSSAKNADINLKVNGELKKLTVDKKADISIKGSTDQTVTIVNNAKGSAVDVKVESAKMALTQPADVKIAEGTNIAKLMVKTDANIEVAKGATVDKVVVTGKDASVAIQADGAVGTVDVNSKAEVALTGSTDQKVELNVNAKDAAVSTAVKTEVNVNADAEVSIEKGAEGSSVAKADGVETKVSNASDDKIVVTDSKGNESSVDAGKTAISNDEGTKEETKEETKDETKKPETETPAGGSSSNSGSTSPSGPVNVDLQGIAVDEETKSVQVGKSIKLTPVFTPANATNKKIWWSVNDGSVASVDENGNVVAKKVGSCIVTAESDQYGFKAAWTITVIEAALTGIKLSQSSLSLYPEDTATLTATAVPEYASLAGAERTSNNTEVATVANGVVTAQTKTGTAIITCSKSSISASCTVTVQEVPAGETMVTLTFKDGNTTLSAKQVVSGAAFTEIVKPTPSRVGHTFEGWTIDGDNLITDIKYTGTTITLNAKFEPIIYTISFSEIGKVFPVKYGEQVTAPGCQMKDGLEFLGWATSQYATTVEVESGGSINCQGNANYYIVSRQKHVKIEATGSSVKFFKSLYYNENRERYIENLNDETWETEWNKESNWQQNSFDGYIPYGARYDNGQQNIYLCFKPENGYCITGVTVDGKPLADKELEAAIWGDVLLSTTDDHTVEVTTAKVELEVSEQAAQVQPSAIDLMECPNISTVIVTTASAIKPSAIFTPSAVGVTMECRVPEIDDKYRLLNMAEELSAGTWGYIVIVGKVGNAEVYSRWIKIQIQNKNESITVNLEGDSGFEVASTNNGYVCTASAITLGAIMAFSADTLSEPQFAFKYNKGIPYMSGDDFVVLDPETTVLESGKTYEIRVEAMEKDVPAGRAFFKLTVNPPAVDSNEGSSE